MDDNIYKGYRIVVQLGMILVEAVAYNGSVRAFEAHGIDKEEAVKKLKRRIDLAEMITYR